MKKIIVLIATYFSLIYFTQAQTGDFQLQNSQQRSYTKAAADSALKGNGIRRLLLGKNYRSEWTGNIRVPVLDLKNDFGGLTPEKEGGGKQTHTLHLKDGSGRDWVLRSVQKFPEGVITSEFKGTVAEALVSDGISASYPYSALSIGTLAKAAGIPYLPNTVVYIPDDPALGEFRSKYKNSLALFELRGGDKDTKNYDTEEIIPELFKNGTRIIDQKATLRARLLDNFIMDFDRHEGQWNWLKKDSLGQKFYTPVPKDRDQSFFKGEGIIPRKLSRMPSLGQLQGLRAKPRNVLTFNYPARNFDRAFLNELDETTWNSEIDAFVSSMTDDVINLAMDQQPQEIKSFHASKISDVLKHKRNSFKEDMMRYYSFISRKVTVLGTNREDVITVSKNSEGGISVTVRDLQDSTVTYMRSFDSGATRELRIYGLEGDDRFLVVGERSPIKIRLIGGPGEDVFINEAEGRRALVYDVSFENNTLSGGFRKKISHDPLNNEYRRINPEYNSSSIGIIPEYARDGGLFLGLNFRATTTGFRREPYAARHQFFVTRGISSPAWHLHYDADFIQIGRKTDLLFRSDAKLPTVRTHFFGYGNNSFFDKRLRDDYYRIQYALIDASLMTRHNLAPWFQFGYGPVLQYFKMHAASNEDYFVNSVHPSTSSDDFYSGKWYGGGEVRATINTRNSQLIPTRGIYFNTYVRGYKGINENTNSFSQLGADLSLYSDFLFRKHVVLATSFGAHRNFDNFEIPQAQYLGFKQNLRGYRYQRFAGEARAYNNTELRINFGDANFYFFKGPAGIVGFHDAGRVWVDEEASSTWHRGYGGGFWLAPFNKMVLMGLLTFSEEERGFPMMVLGFQF